MLNYLRIFVIVNALCSPCSILPAKAKDKTITKEQADRILSELRAIRELLTRQSTVARGDQLRADHRTHINVQGDPVLGSPDAPLTLVEFTDLQCPYCRSFHLETFERLKRDYIDKGKVRFVSVDFPLVDVHRDAVLAARAARCAGEQKKFWEMRDRLHRTTGALDQSSLVTDAAHLQINPEMFRNCLDSERYNREIETDIWKAEQAGIDRTPSFLLGASTPDAVDGEPIVGALLYEVFDRKLKALLEGR